MSRLTERKSNGDIVVDGEYIFHPHTLWFNIADKLAHYEDLEEQGRLIELPCKVGDTVYKLWYKPCHNGEDHPDSYSCCGCEDECDLERTIFEFTIPSIDWILQHLHAFGSYVWFLTKEEAEARLEELKGA